MAEHAQLAQTGKRWTDADCRQAVEAWEASGLSQLEFARTKGITCQRLARAKSRLLKATMSSAPMFLPVTCLASPRSEGASAATLHLGALTIEVASLESISPTWLAQLLAACESSR